jgi:3-hydroxyisobutyrate dehydrogenase-like beta-hydroxyacid dehydrogenase
MQKKRIGFVGLGLMGSGMAKNLMAAGFPLMGYARDESKVGELRRQGCMRVEYPERMGAEVDVIILSLPNSYIVNEVVNNTLKLFECGKKGLIVIDTTTADPILSEELATQLREQGIEMLDAPVSGTSKMCAEKNIIFMVGGREETFRECQPIFSAMGKGTSFLGKNGAAAATKLIVPQAICSLFKGHGHEGFQNDQQGVLACRREDGQFSEGVSAAHPRFWKEVELSLTSHQSSCPGPCFRGRKRERGLGHLGYHFFL